MGNARDSLPPLRSFNLPSNYNQRPHDSARFDCPANRIFLFLQFIPFRSFHYHLRKVMLLVKLDLLSLNWFLFEYSSKLALKCAPFPTIIFHWTIFTSNWQTTSCNDVEFIAISCKVLIIATFNAKMLLKCCLNYEISLNKEINRNR